MSQLSGFAYFLIVSFLSAHYLPLLFSCPRFVFFFLLLLFFIKVSTARSLFHSNKRWRLLWAAMKKKTLKIKKMKPNAINNDIFFFLTMTVFNPVAWIAWYVWYFKSRCIFLFSSTDSGVQIIIIIIIKWSTGKCARNLNLSILTNGICIYYPRKWHT